MKYGCPRLPSEAARLALFTLLLAFLFAGGVAAQPGRVQSVEELQKQLQPNFDEIAARLRNEPRNATLYVWRSKLYMGLYRRAEYLGRDRSAFAAKALADLSTALGLSPTREAYVERAGWYMMLAFAAERPAYERADPWDGLSLKYSRFGAAESDLLHALRLSDGDGQLTGSYAGLAEVYSTKAQHMSTPEAASEMRARGFKYSAWDDFDRAVAYTKEWLKYAPKKAGEWPLYNEEQLARIYHAKGRAAYNLGETGIALAAFDAGEKYFTYHYFEICNYYAIWGETYVKEKRLDDAVRTFTRGIAADEWNCRPLLERRADAYFAQGEMRKALLEYAALWEKEEERFRGRLAVKRARVYLKLNEPDAAVGVLTSALEKTGSSFCPKIYLLRAQAFKL
ncbi:MAG TPA: hypothetical protein VKB12_10290, partial [Pyrinomonadaceae bacterium]|nr:hypothetical protein [Pyrinomonadaceae bacterium]